MSYINTQTFKVLPIKSNVCSYLLTSASDLCRSSETAGQAHIPDKDLGCHRFHV